MEKKKKILARVLGGLCNHLDFVDEETRAQRHWNLDQKLNKY